MDETTYRDTATHSPEPAPRAEGFTDQRLCVVPRPQVDLALAWPVTRRLTVTDAGLFPRAEGHLRVRPHGASETIVLVCVGGAGAVALDGEEYALGPGTSIAIPAGTPHEYHSSDHDPWTIWWLHVRGTDAAELTTTPGASRLVRLRAVDRVVALFDELVALLERRISPAHLLAASGIAWNLLARITVDSTLPAEGSPLERAMRYLETRIDGSIQVADLAALVGLSPSHLSALFRQATGSGPAAFHTSLKMSRARALLDTTSLSVAEIAATVGYADPLYFSRQFRRVHDVSPTTYRAQHKG
jgi:AraC-like DNA-binding protein